MFTFSFHPDFHKQSTRRLTAGGFGKVYYIASDGIPFLEIETNPNSWNPFNAAWFFQQCFCIGSGNEVYFIHLQTGKIKTVSCDMYFGSFHIHKDRLYIASSSRLFCFDSDCELVWKSEEIAVDGVIVNDFSETALSVSCETDPPGGWISCQLSLYNGELLSSV